MLKNVWSSPTQKLIIMISHYKASHQLLAFNQYLYLLNSLSESELDIAISDYICPTELHCNLIPILRDLIESYIPSLRKTV